MKKLLLILAILFLSMPAYSETIEGAINFDWPKLNQLSRDNEIQMVKNQIFTSQTVYKYNKKEFQQQYKKFRKDNNSHENQLCIKIGLKETNDKYLASFYYKKLMIAYGIIYKSDLTHCYYYNALGNLFLVEKYSGKYGTYPVISYQYNTNGILQSSVYHQSDIDEFTYSSNGKFLGRWYGENYYNDNAKVIMKRKL